MPGILPMKVIKVGTNAQTRIAQACDRCRSKKIRCDGVRPCCSQCASVGFECKTSDKLSRRAFPRGYTESLEERVRVLEQEVRELKDLLDEKDEKIDMLSRIHSQPSHSTQVLSPRRTLATSVESPAVSKPKSPAKDDMFKVQQSPYLLDEEGSGSDSYFAGTSSGRTFVEAFKHKVQERGRSTQDINTSALLSSSIRKPSESPPNESPVVYKAPARMVSDQFVNVFFQEWAPLFPVLHRPTFLILYERYVADADTVTDKAEIAQLNLVFGVAALSSGTRFSSDLESFESQWKAALDTIITDNTMATLQALLLAQIYCVQQGDYTRLLSYKGISTTLCTRLGLHQSQKRFALGTLTCETRKKVFWTLYTIDSFSAAVLGLPKHLKDDDVHCELPVDADDEYVTERGFQPTLPGESTKLSSALALFRASRILSKVLEEVFPAKTTYDLSLSRLSELSDELEDWNTQLPPHLRLQFAQDKPSTGTISSRSPLLSLTYHYVRSLIQRPVICASLGPRSQSSMLTMANSCKHMVQIMQLLDERGMSFSFCLNRDELLVLAGFGLLFQGLDLDTNSKLLRDNGKMLGAVITILNKSEAPCASEFERVSHSFVPAQQSSTKTKTPPLTRKSSDGTTSSQRSSQSSTRRQLKAIASRFTSSIITNTAPKSEATGGRRATVHQITLHAPNQQTPDQSAIQSTTQYNPSSVSRSEPARSPGNPHKRPSSNPTMRPSAPPPLMPKPTRQSIAQKPTNLDYLSFGTEPELTSTCNSNTSSATHPIKSEPSPTDWEKLLGSLDNGTTNIFDACYGGRSMDALLDLPSLQPSRSTSQDTPLTCTSDLWALCESYTHPGSSAAVTTPSTATHAPASILSFSTDEGLSSSCEDFAAADWGADGVGPPGETFRGIVMPSGDDGSYTHVWDSGVSI